MKRFTFLVIEEAREINLWNLSETDIQQILEDGAVLVAITTETEE